MKVILERFNDRNFTLHSRGVRIAGVITHLPKPLLFYLGNKLFLMFLLLHSERFYLGEKLLLLYLLLFLIQDYRIKSSTW